MRKNDKHSRKSSALNTSVSTYGKHRLRLIQNDLDWLGVQDASCKKGLFSDSDDSNIIKSSPKKKKRNCLPKKTQTSKKRLAIKCFQKSRNATKQIEKENSKENVYQKKGQLSSESNNSPVEEHFSKDTNLPVTEYKITDYHAITPCSVDLSQDIIPPDLLKRLTSDGGSHSYLGRIDNLAATTANSSVQRAPCSTTIRQTNALINNTDKHESPIVNRSSSGHARTTPCSVVITPIKYSTSPIFVGCSNASNDFVLKLTDESSSMDAADNSVAAKQWPLLNKSKGKYVSNYRRRRNNIFRITDGLSTFSFMDDDKDANDGIWAFQNSIIHADSEFNCNQNVIHNSFDVNFSAPHYSLLVQSTPMIAKKPTVNLMEDHISLPRFNEESHPSNFTTSPVLKQPGQELESNHFTDSAISFSIFSKEPISPGTKNNERIVTNRDRVLLECNQSKPRSFESLCFNNAVVSKLGEGLYGEVYRCYSSAQLHVAVKVIPVEGDIVINGEKQKTFSEVLPEIINSTELSRLPCGELNRTDAFINLYGVHCTMGNYPSYFLHAWDDYRDRRSTDNERPDCFLTNQLYIVFESTDGGVDMEHFKFKSAAQALSVIRQTVAGLAVAEEVYQFEHRDLHWGNILIETNKTTHVDFTIKGETKEIKSFGVTARIIDFTLSRMTKGGLCLYQDLATDPEIFQGNESIDYQFEIYRLMRHEVENDWSQYRPKTNVYWIDYLLRKFLHDVKYKNKRNKVHKDAMKMLRLLQKSILQFASCTQVLEKSEMFRT